MKARLPIILCCLVVAGAIPLMAQLTVSLSPSPAGPQPVGTTITWTATVSGDPDPTPSYEYTFNANPAGAPVQVRKGYGHSNAWTFTPAANAFEGAFTTGVTVKNVHAGTSASTSSNYVFTSRLGGKAVVASATSHPLVALFSAAYCPVPYLMQVRFTPTTVPTGGISSSMVTAPAPCRLNERSGTLDRTSMNFLVGGMYPNTQYQMHWEVITTKGALVAKGSNVSFTTGAVPSTLNFPAFTSTGTSTDTGEPIVLYSVVTIPVNGKVYTSAATDLAGNVLWYSAVPPVRTEMGGNTWGFSNPGSTDIYVAGIRESDLAGNPVLETTVGAINEQLLAIGARPITSFHHEVRRITTPNGSGPNGYILVLANSEQVCGGTMPNCQGSSSSNPVDVLGDQVLVLDQNMNLVWHWDAFSNLDIQHTAILNEQCVQPGGAGCEPFNKNFQTANDWNHTNSAQYTAYDGNIIISQRHQDAVYKLNFNNGAGDGHIIWELGLPNQPDGMPIIGGVGGTPLPHFQLFTIGTTGPDLGYPWFSHQHDSEVELGGFVFNGGFRVMTLFDDGNTRQAYFNPNADSRCHVLAINESALVANLNTNGDLGSYSFAVGSAQLLKNGNLHCDSGFIGGLAAATTNPLTESVEMTQQGTTVYVQNAAQDSYRTFRMQDMFTADNP